MDDDAYREGMARVEAMFERFLSEREEIRFSPAMKALGGQGWVLCTEEGWVGIYPSDRIALTIGELRYGNGRFIVQPIPDELPHSPPTVWCQPQPGEELNTLMEMRDTLQDQMAQVDWLILQADPYRRRSKGEE